MGWIANSGCFGVTLTAFGRSSLITLFGEWDEGAQTAPLTFAEEIWYTAALFPSSSVKCTDA